MHPALCISPNSELVRHIHENTPIADDQFATTPIRTVGPAYQQPNEEELHTLFEQAISERVLLIHGQLSSQLAQNRGVRFVGPSTDPLVQSNQSSPAAPSTLTREVPPSMPQVSTLLPVVPWNIWHWSIILGGLAL